MLLFSIGLPSSFTGWCDALLVRLVADGGGRVDTAVLNTMDDVATAAIRSTGDTLVGLSRRPVPRLQAEIIATGRPFLVVLGDPLAAVGDLITTASLGVADATRAVASSCADLVTLAAAPGALVIASSSDADLVLLGQEIADHFQLNVSRSQVSAALSDLEGAGLVAIPASSNSWRAGLDRRGEAVISGALQHYIAHFNNREPEPIIWHPELFYASSNPPSSDLIPATEPVDITGRVRFVIYGPFIDLPQGSWSATLVLGFSAEAIGMGFAVEAFAGKLLGQTRIEASSDQVVEVNLHFIVDSSIDGPLQFRIINERAAFDGRIALAYASIAQQAMVSAEAREYLTGILRK